MRLAIANPAMPARTFGERVREAFYREESDDVVRGLSQ